MLVREGARVVIAGRDGDCLKKTAAELGAEAAAVFPLVLEITGQLFTIDAGLDAHA